MIPLSPILRDHARGNAELVRLLPGLVVLGADERICALTRRLAHGEELRVSARPGGAGREPGPNHLTCPCAAVWGHPRALPPDARPHLGPHELLPVGRGVSGPSCCVLGYWLPCTHLPHLPVPHSTLSDPPNSPGDALSMAGCGSRLEGTAQQMYQSLVETLGTLPPETVSGLPLALSCLWGPGFPYKQHALNLSMPGFRMIAFLPAVARSGLVRGSGTSLPIAVLCT